MHKKIIFLLFFSLSVSNAYALNYFNFLYKVEDGDTFSLILKKFVKDESIVNAKTPFVKKTRDNNPQEKHWDQLKPGTIIELYVSDDFMDLEKYKPYKESTLKKIAEEEEKKKRPAYPVGLKGSLFYMSSIGIFTQKTDNVAEINFKQNSPVSLGTAFTYYPADKLYSFSFSTYYSYLLASADSISSDTVSIPPEIGANLYSEYRWQKYNMTLHVGPDYESFSLFNLRGLQNDKKIYVDKVGVTYLTLGMAKAFTLFNRQLFSKLSFSKSLLTSYQNNAPPITVDASDHIDDGKYSGYRFLFYLNYKLSDKFYVHTLFKYHKMTGPSELATIRVGAGVGFILF